MSDETPQAPHTADTPEPGPDLGTPVAPDAQQASTVDYEGRYNDLRSEFDRRNQLISAAQQGDPGALEALGFELADDQQAEQPQFDAEGFDPYDPNAVAQLVRQQVEEALTPFQQQQQQEQVELASASALHAIEGFETLPAEAQEMVWARAQQLPPNHDGLYDVQAAYQQFQALQTALQKSWADSKAAAPKVSAGGQAATDVPSLDDASLSDLTQWAAERYRDLSA